MTALVEAARARAAADLEGAARPASPSGPFPETVVLGDPQTSPERVFRILARHGLLTRDGVLVDGVHLVSIGDHFDWGPFEDRLRAARQGAETLAWLAAHPPEQVTLVLGNHDVARLGELEAFDDEAFAAASEQAARAYRGGDTDPALEAALLARYPGLPSAEVGARDLSCFLALQRDLVLRLLRAGRFVVARDFGPRLLVTHAGLAVDHLRFLGLGPAQDADAPRIAARANQALAAAVAAWAPGTPLAIPGLHQPGSAAEGEGVGVLYHRPGAPRAEWDDRPLDTLEAGQAPPLRRVFDARRLPRGLTQVVGHVRDHRMRKLLGGWADEAPARDGVLRHLATDGVTVTYRHGLPGRLAEGWAHVLFTDVGLQYVDPDEVQLLDLGRLAVRPPV